MEVEKGDVLTPANVLSTIGLGLTIAGAANIDHVSGIAMIGVGRTLDLVDGYVARRTHTSDLGAVVDATFDKLGVAAIVIQAARHDAAPEAVLGLIAAFNVVNAVANVYTDRKGAEAKTSKSGKYGMFGQNLALGGYALSHALGGNAGLDIASTAAFAGSFPSATKASVDYTRQALRAKKMTPKNPKTYNRRKR